MFATDAMVRNATSVLAKGRGDFVIANRQIYRNENVAIHRNGCRDLKREVGKNAALIYDGFDSVEEALDFWLDDEMREMGYDESHVKVYNCCRVYATR